MKYIIRRLLRKSVVRNWALSYLLILLIPILFSFAVYLQAENTIKEQLNESSYMVLKELRETFDPQLAFAYSLSMKIAIHPTVQELQSRNIWNDKGSPYSHVEMIQELKDNINTAPDSYVKDVSIIVHPQKTILSSFGKYTEKYNSIFVESMNIAPAEWERLIRSGSGFFALESGGMSNVLVYKQNIPFHNAQNPRISILILFDERPVARWISHLRELDLGEIYILNENNQLMLSSDDEAPLPLFDLLPEDESSVRYGNWQGNPYVLSRIHSEFLKWSYVYITPESVFTKKLNDIKWTAIWSVALSVMVASLMALFLVRSHYKPIGKIITFISSEIKSKVKQGGERNELDLIQTVIDSTIKENTEYRQRLDRQNKVLHSHIIERLLKGKLETNGAVDDLLYTMNIDTSSENFMVLIIYVEDHALNVGKHEQDETAEWTLVRFIIMNIMGEMLDRMCRQVIVEMDDWIVGLINLNVGGREHTDRCKQQLIGVIRQAQDVIEGKFRIRFSVSLSNNHRTLTNISAAYEEALNAMEYKLLLGSSKIIDFESIRGLEPKHDYSIEQEQWLINYIRAGDFKQAKELVDELFHRFSSGKTNSIEMMKLSVFDIASTVIKAADQLMKHSEQVGVKSKLNDLMNTRMITDMKEHLLSMMEEITEAINERKMNANKELIQHILDYIQNNYDRVELSVSSIADHFHRDAVYLSRYFRESYGEGLLSVICNIRLNQAKHLLCHSDRTVKEIATQIGFYNSNAFIRTFKKYEGITPGTYRELHTS